jgi:hypothetical protein
MSCPGGGWAKNGMGAGVGKECRRVNMVQTLCTHVSKWKKMLSAETIPGMEG